MNNNKDTSASNSNKTETLAEIAGFIDDLISKHQPRVVDGVPTELHTLPPFVSRDDWGCLGNALRKVEQPTLVRIGGEKWISLRCDGTGFSKLTKRLQKEGIFGSGYSEEFGNIMQSCCRNLMAKFSTAKCGYTQSDEITVLLPPASVVRGEQQVHIYGGRIQKLCSQAAATVTSTFTTELMSLCNKGNKLDCGLEILQQYTPTFDCRVGVFDTKAEALSLILWRAYDCGINATSDAVYKSGISGGRAVVEQSTDHRLRWLHQHHLLPLQPHQREGTFLVKRKRAMEGVNQKTGQPITYCRQRVEQVHGCVIQLYKDRMLLPPDDKEPGSADEEEPGTSVAGGGKTED